MDAIVLLGGPGAGKGTVAERIRKATAYRHVSTGDILREAVKAGTPVGQEAERFMKAGELVPDEVIIRLVETRLDAGAKSDSYMFDGFPRTVRQAELLEAAFRERGGSLSHVFNLEAPREVLVLRLTGRRLCRKCGAGYHVVNIPPQRAGICDTCGGELYQRDDDSEATILNRLEVFRAQTRDLIAFYRQRGLLVDVDAGKTPEVTEQAILARICA